MEQSYRIRTNVGEDQVVKAQIQQDMSFLEILSLKINQVDVYKQHTSNYGVIAGRVLANEAFGIPNAKISVFIALDDIDEKNSDITQFYPYTTVRTQDGDGIKYNLLPDSSNDECQREVGTFPNKRLVLDNDTLIEVFDKYWKYTTVTNNSGDYMIFGVPTGNHQVHVDIDLSDIGVLSQKPRDFMYKGYNITQFDNANQFKESTNLDNLSQLISQDTTVYVYPFWGSSDNEEIAISRCDIQVQYKFEPTCVFFGSIVSDNFSNNIGHKCNPSKFVGFNRNLVAGEGTIEMIRKTHDGLVEEVQIQGNHLIDGNGVWCYQIPMNLDYVQTNEFGQIVPSDNGKGLATRTSVRFRFSMSETSSEGVSRHRAKYLVPNVHELVPDNVKPQISNPQSFNQCFEFGSATPDEFFRDLYWNKVYTVKNYIPRIQLNGKPNTQNYSAIRTTNDSGNLNPFPFNKGRFRLVFGYRVLCVLMSIIFTIIKILNTFLSSIICLKIPIIKIRPFKFLCGAVKCIAIRGGLTEDEDSNIEYFPGCKRGCNCMMKCEVPGCQPETSYDQLMDTVQQNLSQEYDIVNLDFYNDWINGCLYMPLWFWRKTKKKKFLFGLFSRKAVNTYCSCDKNYSKLRVTEGCSLPWANQNDGGYSGGSKKTNYHNHFPSNPPRTVYGIVKEVENKDGLKVYYYTPGLPTSKDAKTRNSNDVSDYVRLYSTDIVLLGSLNECDFDNLPRPFINLPSTTANVPYIATLKSTMTDDSDEDSRLEGTIEQEAGIVEVTGMDWTDHGSSDKPQYGQGLLLDLTCVKVSTKPKSCINLERMSELGVSLDINTSRAIPENGRIKYDTTQTADGMITRYEIVDNETRAMFATLNHNGLTEKVKNPITGYDTYKLAYVYPTDFDGKLAVEARAYTNMMPFKTYDNADKEYINFRLGKVYRNGGLTASHFYDGNYFPLFNNSFYFYFGLNEGNTAIDKFNSMFYAACYRNQKYPFTMTYTTTPAKMCSSGNEPLKNDYGTIDIQFKGVQLPYSYTLSNNFGDIILTESNVSLTNLKFGYGINASGYTNEKYGIFSPTTGQTSSNDSNAVFVENGIYIIHVSDTNGNSIKQTIELNQVALQASVSTIALGDKYKAPITDENGNVTMQSFEREFCGDNALYGEIVIKDISIDGETFTIKSARSQGEDRYLLTLNNDSIVILSLATQDDTTISKCMCSSNSYTVSEDGMKLKIWVPGQYTLTFQQQCGNELNGNDYTTTVTVNNGETFNVFVNDVPYNFVSKWSTNKAKYAWEQSLSPWFNLTEPTVYSFPSITNTNGDVWSEYVETVTVDGKMIKESGLNALGYELSSMFNLAQGAYIVDDGDNTLTFSNNGGKGPILFRSNYPQYSKLDNNSTIENKVDSGNWIFDSEGYVTCSPLHPNIISKNYTNLNSQVDYSVAVLRKSDSSYANTNCPNDLIGKDYAFNPIFANHQDIGNYFAAFTANGGIKTTTSGTCAADASVKYLKVPAAADPYQTICPTATKEGFVSEKVKNYFRTYFLDKRLDYDMVVFAPTYYNPTNIPTAANDWRLGRISGLTYNGVEFLYDNEYNIVKYSGESTNELEYIVSKVGMSDDDQTFTNSMQLQHSRKGGFLYEASLGGNDYKIDLRDKSTYHQTQKSQGMKSHIYGLPDLLMGSDIYGNVIKNAYKSGGTYSNKAQVQQSNYPLIREYDIKCLPPTTKLEASFTSFSYNYDLSQVELTDNYGNTIVRPHLQVEPCEPLTFTIDCRNMIVPVTSSLTDMAYDGNYTLYYKRTNGNYNTASTNSHYAEHLKLWFKVNNDKYNTTHSVATFIPYIISEDVGNGLYWEAVTDEGHKDKNKSKTCSSITEWISVMKSSNILNVLHNLDGRGINWRRQVEYQNLTPTTLDIWSDTFNTAAPHGHSKNNWRWVSPDDNSKPVFDDDSNVKNVIYRHSFNGNEFAIVLLRQYVSNANDNLSKNIFVVHTSSYFNFKHDIYTSCKLNAFSQIDEKDENGTPYSAQTMEITVKTDSPDWNSVNSELPCTIEFNGLILENASETIKTVNGSQVTWKFTFSWKSTTPNHILGTKTDVRCYVLLDNRFVCRFDVAAQLQGY